MRIVGLGLAWYAFQAGVAMWEAGGGFQVFDDANQSATQVIGTPNSLAPERPVKSAGVLGLLGQAFGVLAFGIAAILAVVSLFPYGLFERRKAVKPPTPR